MSDYRNLSVWQKAHQLVLATYRSTASFPKEEMYGLTGQMRRAAASIPANIAEGAGRGSNADFVRFLRIALGSTNEIEYHVLLARDLGLLTIEAHDQLGQNIAEIRRMLTALIGKLQAS